MPRPCKRRRVCAEPSCGHFGPKDAPGMSRQTVTMTLDEFEAIRLIDREGRNQEQCALLMNVARTTVQAIYSSARGKLAECLVDGKELRIEGGDYVLCDGSIRKTCGCGNPNCRCDSETQEEMTMKIAVTYENGQVFQHFGHTEQFKIYDVADGKIVSAQVVDTNGSGHGALGGFLAAMGVDTLICGGIGGGAQNALQEAGIQFYGGASGNADQAVEALLAGKLAFDPNVHCDHHDHEGHHHGGDHHCGGHCGH